MRYVNHQKVKIVFDKDPEGFEDKYNQITDELENFDLDIEINTNRPEGFCAVIRYTTSQRVPEDLSDEMSIRGLNITCADCPYLIRTKDNRRVKFPCPYASFGYTRLDTPACNKFYKDLVQFFYEHKTELPEGSKKQLVHEDK